MDAEKKRLLAQLAEMGDVVLVTDGKRIELNDFGVIPLQTQEDAVLYFLQRLDSSMVSSVLDDGRTYQDFAKPIFIKKLDTAMDAFIAAGDSYLNRYPGICNSRICNFKCAGYSFVGHKSGAYIDLIIDVKDGMVHDIYECSDFNCDSTSVVKKRRIEIDATDIPF
jgi:hypothetical protein